MTSVGTETEPLEVDRVQGLLDWTRLNSRALSIAAGLIVVAGAGYWFYLRSQQITAANAERALLTAKQSVGAGNLPLAQTDLKKVSDKYESTPAGVQAAMILAQMDFDAAKYDDGIKKLEKAAGSSAAASLQTTILSLEGDGYAQMGKPVEAAKKYEEAAAATKYNTEKSYQRGKAARAYQFGGDLAKARAIWTELATDSKSVAMASEARVRLGELTAQPAKK